MFEEHEQGRLLARIEACRMYNIKCVSRKWRVRVSP